MNSRSTNVRDFRVEGMTCAACVGRVERALRGVDGVVDVRVNLATEGARIETSETTSNDALRTAVDRAGYALRDRAADPGARRRLELEATASFATRTRRARNVALALGGPLMVLAMTPALRTAWTPWLELALATAVLVGPGWVFHRSAWRATRTLDANMDSLVSVGSIAAYVHSLVTLLQHPTHGAHVHLYFETSAMIIALVLVGKSLEDAAKERARTSLRALGSLLPTTARVERDGGLVDVSASDVRVGDRVHVRARERVPSDGVVVEGTAEVDEAWLTGESATVVRPPNARVHGGSPSVGGPFVLVATAVGGATAIARLVALVEAAQATKADIERLADRVSRVFVPSVIALALATLVGWSMRDVPTATALMHAIAVLVIACPCALGLATPTAMLVATSAAAERGVLVRDARALEVLHRVDLVAFDKTGTLTVGAPELAALRVGSDTDEATALAWAAGLERGSEHPLAAAVLHAANARGIAPASVENVNVEPGVGVRGTHEGRMLVLRAAREEDPARLDDAHDNDALTRSGHTLVVLTVDDAPRALLAFRDALRPDGAATLRALRERGLRVQMWSGDSDGPVRGTATTLGLTDDEWAARCTPADKLSRIDDARRAGRVVAMLGDGINDAPALARADVGIAMGSGTDVARDVAALTLVRGELIALVHAIDLSRATMHTIRQNLAWAFGYNVVAIPLAALGALDRFGGPMLAAGLMALSSVSVVANSLRLRGAMPSARDARAG